MPCVCSQYTATLETFSDVEDRCAASTQLLDSLDEVAIDALKWMAVYRCRDCGCLWAEEYPFGERHGGGPVCLYLLPPCDPFEWLASNDGFTLRLRQQHEDALFLDSLGPESGDNECRKQSCKNRTVRLSVFCRQHHFEMVKSRPSPP